MSSISPFSSSNEALYAASLTQSSATSTASSGSLSASTATPEDSVSLTHPDAREVFQLGRVAYQEQAGNISSAQGSQIDSLIQQLQTAVQSDEQSGGGTLTATQSQNIQQMQDGLSKEIYANAHDLSNGSNQIVPPAVPAS